MRAIVQQTSFLREAGYSLVFDYGFDTITVGIENIARVVQGVVLLSNPRRDVILTSRCQRGLVESIHGVAGLSLEREMNCRRARASRLQPEESISFTAEPFQVGMPIFAIEVDVVGNSERSESLFVECHRNAQIRDGQNDMVEHISSWSNLPCIASR